MSIETTSDYTATTTHDHNYPAPFARQPRTLSTTAYIRHTYTSYNHGYTHIPRRPHVRFLELKGSQLEIRSFLGEDELDNDEGLIMALDVGGSNNGNNTDKGKRNKRQGVEVIGDGVVIIRGGCLYRGKGKRGAKGKDKNKMNKKGNRNNITDDSNGKVIINFGSDMREYRRWCLALQFVNRRIEDYYRIVGNRLLGKGRLAEVVFGFDIRSGEHVAIKVVDKMKSSGTKVGWWNIGNVGYSGGIGWEREVDMRYRIEADESDARAKEVIVRTWDMFETRFDVFFVSEFMAGGNLEKYLLADAEQDMDIHTAADDNMVITGIREEDAKIIMTRLFQALQYLHTNDIVHRNVKTKNLLMQVPHDDHRWPSTVKLHDFALAAHLDDTAAFQTVAGSPEFMSPEAASMSTDDRGNRFVDVSTDSDMWSAGVVLYHILTKQLPFDGETAPDVLARAKKGFEHGFPKNVSRAISPEAQSVIKGLLQPIRRKRYTAQTVLLHKWFETDIPTSPQAASNLPGTSGLSKGEGSEQGPSRLRGRAALQAAITVVRWIVMLIDETPGIERSNIMQKSKRVEFNVATFVVDPGRPTDGPSMLGDRTLVPREQLLTTALHGKRRKSTVSKSGVSLDSSVGSLTSLTLSDRSRERTSARSTSLQGGSMDDSEDIVHSSGSTVERDAHSTLSSKLFGSQSRVKQIFNRRDYGVPKPGTGKRVEVNNRLRILPRRMGNYLTKNTVDDSAESW